MATKRLFMTRGDRGLRYTVTDQQQFDGRPVELEPFKADLLGIIVQANEELSKIVESHVYTGNRTKEQVASQLDALAVSFEVSLQTIKRYERDRKALAKKEAARAKTESKSD